ncbi:MAG: hypothetical protein ACFFBK_14880 [Promethearchaeota archaeon]
MDVHKLIPPNILITGEKSVGKSTILDLFSSEKILDIDENLKIMIKKQIELDDLQGINQCILRVINLEDLISDFKSYKNLLQYIDIICIIIDSTIKNLESTHKLLLELKQNTQDIDYYVINSFQDRKKVLELEKVEDVLGEKTFGFSAVQKDSKEQIISIIKDIIRMSILNKGEFKRLRPEDEEFIELEEITTKWTEKIHKVKEKYQDLWSEVEKARVLEKQGEHFSAGKKFSTVASLFKEMSSKLHIKQEKEETFAMYYLCKAWGCMELAREYKEPEKFTEAVKLFTLASEHIYDNDLKLLTLGNSVFCKALKLGLEFDILDDSDLKAKYYPQIKEMIRKAADLYREGGFINEAEWALATSSYFDAIWHLIRAEKELNLDEKKRIIDVIPEIFLSSAKLFRKAGYKDKEKEVLDYLRLFRKEWENDN